MEVKKIMGTEDNWENRFLGCDEKFVAKSQTRVDDVNSILGLQPISIRLQKEMIENLKFIANKNGLGYQPLIRQVITRFVNAEMNLIRQEEGMTVKSTRKIV